ncbi:hypothetical protein KC640_01105 [Candidatus Dojkabacteria bacterium]|uniref:Lipoprotein n=1 Tax=Candidatus Dojkabacteria bacterium TaxID=2099670 RepID=A0A955I6X7_9BACT|nr:hypothetical protein [Candidatus Dojkabacteria bacterium]
MRKYSALVFVFLIALLLVGCMPTQSTDDTQTQQQGGGGAVEDVNSCVANCSVVGGGLAATCNQGCWIQEAERAGDPQLCISNLDEEVLQMGCVANVAEAEGDPEMCSILGDSADLCYSAYAADQGDITVCDKIQDSMYRAVCQATFE